MANVHYLSGMQHNWGLFNCYIQIRFCHRIKRLNIFVSGCVQHMESYVLDVSIEAFWIDSDIDSNVRSKTI